MALSSYLSLTEDVQVEIRPKGSVFVGRVALVDGRVTLIHIRNHQFPTAGIELVLAAGTDFCTILH